MAVGAEPWALSIFLLCISRLSLTELFRLSLELTLQPKQTKPRWSSCLTLLRSQDKRCLSPEPGQDHFRRSQPSDLHTQFSQFDRRVDAPSQEQVQASEGLGALSGHTVAFLSVILHGAHWVPPPERFGGGGVWLLDDLKGGND